MRLMSPTTLRSAGAAALALAAGLAHAHSGHGARVLDGHVHIERLFASTMALIGPFIGELAVASVVVFGAMLIWKNLRPRRSSR